MLKKLQVLAKVFTEAEAARAPFEEDIQSARAELDEAIVQRDDQALEVKDFAGRGEAAEPQKRSEKLFAAKKTN